MPNISLDVPPPLPRWLRIVVTVGLVAHIVAILGVVIHAVNGPWMIGSGLAYFPGPQFAAPIEEAATPYLSAIRMTHTYRFQTDQTKPSVSVEIVLRDEKGHSIKTVRLPDPNANPWVRHRQSLLADGLMGDFPLPPMESERLSAPNKSLQKTFWDFDPKEPNKNYLRTVSEHLVPRDRPAVFAPSEWSLLVAKSYSRHLCEAHGAATAEIVRRTRQPLLAPVFVPGRRPPDPFFDEMIASFGVHRRDQ